MENINLFFNSIYRNYPIKHKKILNIRFEDFVKSYDKTAQKIIKFFKLDPSKQIKKRKHFNPDISIKNVEIYNDTIAVAVYDEDGENSNLICAKAADELLTISDITASFVMTKMDEKVYISGRSIGDINVQVILEKLGGGGHITLAGAQLEGLSLEEAKLELINKINEYLEEIQ